MCLHMVRDKEPTMNTDGLLRHPLCLLFGLFPHIPSSETCVVFMCQ